MALETKAESSVLPSNCFYLLSCLSGPTRLPIPQCLMCKLNINQARIFLWENRHRTLRHPITCSVLFKGESHKSWKTSQRALGTDIKDLQNRLWNLLSFPQLGHVSRQLSSPPPPAPQLMGPLSLAQSVIIPRWLWGIRAKPMVPHFQPAILNSAADPQKNSATTDVCVVSEKQQWLKICLLKLFEMQNMLKMAKG